MDNISPIDGRYHNITKSLSSYFSEFSFMKYRLYVELQYFVHLIDVLPELKSIASPSIKSQIINIWKMFDKDDFNIIKQYEIILNHDIKALEYFIRDKFKTIGLEKYTSFIHFGITSQDINTSANILALKESLFSCIIPNISKIVSNINSFIQNLGPFSTMLGFTHGQPAVPTTMSKEFHVFVYRINEQLKILNTMPFTTKFGGAVGNFNAHYAAYPEINWTYFANNFIRNIGLQREQFTTQISNYASARQHQEKNRPAIRAEIPGFAWLSAKNNSNARH